jgi:HD-like signal output (HDOD) protein
LPFEQLHFPRNAMTHNKAANVNQRAVNAHRVLVDEELWFGSFDEEAAEKAAARSLAAIVGQVLGAKPFPESARRLAELSAKDTAQVREMVEVLEQDPALSAKLLRVVNSAGFGLRQQCTSVRHAVTLVGSKHIHQMATTAAVLDLFSSDTPYAVQILEHSSAVGALSRYLGTHLALPTEELFTAGVLHDFGKLMLLDTMEEPYQALLEKTLGQSDVLHAFERAEYGFDHGVLAAHVLKSWNIPDPIPKIIAWHHEPSRAYATSSLHAGLVQTVRFADALVNAMANGASHDQVSELARHEAASYLDISEAQLGSMWDEMASLRARAVMQHRGDKADEPSVARVKTPSIAAAAPAPVPQHFPCVACGKPSFGSTCPVCKGYICPNHPLVSRGWCTVCAAEFKGFSSVTRFPISARMAILGAIALVATSATLGQLTNGSQGIVRGLLAGMLFSAIGGGVFYVIQRVYLRSRFVRSRPDRSQSRPEQE